MQKKKDVFETSNNDLKFTVQNCRCFCTNLILQLKKEREREREREVRHTTATSLKDKYSQVLSEKGNESSVGSDSAF